MLVDKPEGISSHDAIDRVRQRLGIKRVGHTGTLDPFASGLLIVLVGAATRLARFVEGGRKRYTGEIRLGSSTTTDDRTGRIIEVHDARNVDATAVAQSMAGFVGEIVQRPPAFSAKKVAGTRAYERARQGEPMPLRAVKVSVQQFELLGLSRGVVSFVATVGTGTYIRALARDLGEALGVHGHLHTLRRTDIGSFTVDDAVAPDGVETSMLAPSRVLLGHLETVSLDTASANRVRHGQSIPATGAEHGPIAMLERDVLIAVAEPAGAVLKPRVVLVP